MAKPNGAVIYKGESLLGHGNIVAIVTGIARRSKNPKTGNMVQVWILPDNGIEPHKAWKCNGDLCVCGDCPLRKVENGKRVCYVQLHQAPLAVYRAYKNGKYPTLAEYPEALEKLKGKPIRFGAYGDPVAVPFEYMKPLYDIASQWTGYTHQWRKDIAKPWRAYLQASCETANDTQLAQQQGWHYFRVLPENVKPQKNEIVCPSATGAHCESCGLCNGNKCNVCITVHGTGKRYYK